MLCGSWLTSLIVILLEADCYEKPIKHGLIKMDQTSGTDGGCGLLIKAEQPELVDYLLM